MSTCIPRFDPDDARKDLTEQARIDKAVKEAKAELTEDLDAQWKRKSIRWSILSGLLGAALAVLVMIIWFTPQISVVDKPPASVSDTGSPSTIAPKATTGAAASASASASTSAATAASEEPALQAYGFIPQISGDSFSRECADFYGDGSEKAYRAAWAETTGVKDPTNPDLIVLGQTLWLPATIVTLDGRTLKGDPERARRRYAARLAKAQHQDPATTARINPPAAQIETTLKSPMLASFDWHLIPTSTSTAAHATIDSFGPHGPPTSSLNAFATAVAKPTPQEITLCENC